MLHSNSVDRLAREGGREGDERVGGGGGRREGERPESRGGGGRERDERVGGRRERRKGREVSRGRNNGKGKRKNIQYVCSTGFHAISLEPC